MTTNITPEMVRNFEALTSGQYKNFALFSCFIDGRPGAAIVAITKGEGDSYTVTPLFITIPEGVVLTDHDGVPA